MTKDTIFLQNPSIEEYFKTSDGQAFYHEADAKMHAKRLKNKSIEKVEKHCETKVQLVDSQQSSSNDERESLIARYTELFEKAPAKNIGLNTLKTRIAEKELELKTQNTNDETKD